MSTNGSAPTATSGSATIDALRKRPINVHLFRGFGPALAGVVLFALMLWLAPSVAPEHIVERPVSTTTPETTIATTTATTLVVTTSVPGP